MNDALTRWLCSNFVGVADVRRASTDPDSSVIFKKHQADVVVSTWMGARLYLYLVQKPLKVRDIKKTIKENSRDGIGTLFFVNSQHLPAHDSVVHLSDWQEALMVLNGDFIYAYQIEKGSASIVQVHYSAATARDEFRVWHLRDFEIENVSVRKRDVQGNLRGTWFVGDIASPSYKRRMNSERMHQRFHYSTKYTQEIPGRSANGKIRPRQDEIAQYYIILGVDRSASEEQIKRAYRQLAMQVHPDVSALPRQEAHRRFLQLNEAYEAIKTYHGWT